MKKTLSIISLLMVLFLSVTVASAKDKKESAVTTFTVSPQMTCQNCENRIKSNIRFEKGVADIVTDLKTQTVTVTYDTKKTNPEKLVNAFKKIGYTATIADPSAVKVGAVSCKDNQKSCGKCEKKSGSKDCKKKCPQKTDGDKCCK